MKVVESQISIEELKEMSLKMYNSLVKAVVDIEKEMLVIDADLHADEEEYLLKLGSKQENLWGINIYPNFEKEKRIEFDSMINLRPSYGNNSRGVDNEDIQKKILEIVNSKIVE